LKRLCDARIVGICFHIPPENSYAEDSCPTRNQPGYIGQIFNLDQITPT
jgi:hypothetical protein